MGGAYADLSTALHKTVMGIPSCAHPSIVYVTILVKLVEACLSVNKLSGVHLGTCMYSPARLSHRTLKLRCRSIRGGLHQFCGQDRQHWRTEGPGCLPNSHQA